jgi:hypothetical protein
MLSQNALRHDANAMSFHVALLLVVVVVLLLPAAVLLLLLPHLLPSADGRPVAWLQSQCYFIHGRAWWCLQDGKALALRGRATCVVCQQVCFGWLLQAKQSNTQTRQALQRGKPSARLQSHSMLSLCFM